MALEGIQGKILSVFISTTLGLHPRDEHLGYSPYTFYSHGLTNFYIARANTTAAVVYTTLHDIARCINKNYTVPVSVAEPVRCSVCNSNIDSGCWYILGIYQVWNLSSYGFPGYKEIYRGYRREHESMC